uniref:Tetratricopeptide repeat protein n=1 Tax=Desulfatirhabdium butyrativorans TaxID=340467 RepID=A0A7C4RUI7_9BACT
MAQKISRKQLLKEPDEFLTFSARLLQWIAAYRSQALIGVAVLLGIGVLVSGYQMLHRSWEKDAFTKLHGLTARYEKLQKSDGPAKAYETMQKEFDSFLSDSSRRTAGKIGLLTWAKFCVEASQLDKAIDVYGKAVDVFQSDPILASLARSALGHLYLKQSDTDRALSLFETVASAADATPVVVEDALIQLSAIYRQRQDEPKSRQYLQTLVQKYPNSIYKELATGLANG